MRRLSTLLISLMVVLTMFAGTTDFDALFSDTTLRLDYILGGTKQHPTVSQAAAAISPGWHGRRHNLATFPLQGNARLTATANGDTLYTTTFSTLYNEWLDTGDSIARAFECTVLMPRPRQTVNLSLEIYDMRHNVIAAHNATLNPNDILTRTLPRPPYKVTLIHNGNYDGPRIPVAILPEGFRKCEMDSFHTYARRTVEAIIDHEPFKSFGDRFEFIAVDVPSADSDVSKPAEGEWRDTAFGSHFSTFYSDRYLTSPRVFAMHDALSGLPYQHIIILANTATYGGGGIFNFYTITNTGNKLFRPVVVHEFGHSFGGLADEYFYDEDIFSDLYPHDIEPWEPNITTLAHFHGKWENLIDPDTPTPTPSSMAARYHVGLYEGGGYAAHGVYRPADVCRMRINETDSFCPACIQALTRLIQFYTEN